ncbi:unnamed protein product [Rhizoctonia solani]|uniref:Uncharacterized protein n=1 Tax=Rhizoctonia solani TaxID=456999 RepID=A0A8H3E0M2_9AGAM|nr:unnamed protein product [Rhizoctonia solani]
MQEANVIPPITTQVDAHRDNAPLPHHGLRGGSKARFKAGSQVDTWAELVGWDGEFRELDADACKDRPEVKKLKEVVEKSYMVPAWLADLKSSKYTYFTGMERSHEIVEDLSFLVSRPKYTKVENDESLSGDVEECLPFLLQIIRHTNELQSHNVLFEPMKTDRRHPVDLIASLVWDIQSNGCVVYRTERLLQIPHPSERQNPGLKEVVEKSYMVPAWLADRKSSKCTYFTEIESLREIADNLSMDISDPQYIKVKDNKSLSDDVAECLSFIFQIFRHTDGLESQNSSLVAMEADRRHPVDVLASLVWDIQSGGHVVYRTERLLQIPYPSKRKNNLNVKPDGCAYIPIPGNITKMVVEPKDTPALSCFYTSESSPPNCSYILHWVTEFKRRAQAVTSRQQVVEGLVSALYQRRAFGFPNHFVFGTAHYNQNILEVLAATWVPSEPANPGARPTQEAGVESAAPAEGQANVPSGSASRAVVAEGGESGTAGGTENPSPTVEEIMKYNKIVVYTIAKFSMTHLPSLLQLHLLMRHTRTLAEDYEADIKKHSQVLLRQLVRQAKDIYRWAPPPPPPPSDRASKRRKTRSDMPPVDEDEDREDGDEYDMSIDQDDSSGSISDPQELDSLDDLGPTCRIAGDVAKYTVRNYAHEYNEGTGDRKVGDPHPPQLSTSQIA